MAETGRTRRSVALALGFACLVATGVGAAALKVDLRADARASAFTAVASSTGKFAVAFGVGVTARPQGLRLRIESKPEQWITAVWVVTCHRGLALKTSGGSISGRSPLARELSLPIVRPERCSIFAGGQLEGTGAISVRVTARGAQHP